LLVNRENLVSELLVVTVDKLPLFTPSFKTYVPIIESRSAGIPVEYVFKFIENFDSNGGSCLHDSRLTCLFRRFEIREFLCLTWYLNHKAITHQ